MVFTQTQRAGVVAIHKNNEPIFHDLLCRMAEVIADELGMSLIAESGQAQADALSKAFHVCLPGLPVRAGAAPDLMIEIVMTEATPEAAHGIRECWRFDGERLAFYALRNGVYQEQNDSLAFPFVQAEDLAAFLEQSKADGTETVLWRLKTLMQKHKPVSN
jgi:hypothetical protein